MLKRAALPEVSTQVFLCGKIELQVQIPEKNL